MPTKSPNGSVSIDAYLRKFPPDIQTVANMLRELVRQTAPHCIERLYPGWKLIGYRAGAGNKSHYFGFIYPTAERVVLGFEYGTMLSDPEGVLEGTGTRVRSVTFRSRHEVRKSTLTPLIAEAVSIATERRKGKR